MGLPEYGMPGHAQMHADLRAAGVQVTGRSPALQEHMIDRPGAAWRRAEHGHLRALRRAGRWGVDVRFARGTPATAARFCGWSVFELLLQRGMRLRRLRDQQTPRGLAVQPVHQYGRSGEGEFLFLEEEGDAVQDRRFILRKSRCRVHGDTCRFLDHEAGRVFVQDLEFQIFWNDVALRSRSTVRSDLHAILRFHQMRGLADDAAVQEHGSAPDERACLHAAEMRLRFRERFIQPAL